MDADTPETRGNIVEPRELDRLAATILARRFTVPGYWPEPSLPTPDMLDFIKEQFKAKHLKGDAPPCQIMRVTINNITVIHSDLPLFLQSEWRVSVGVAQNPPVADVNLVFDQAIGLPRNLDVNYEELVRVGPSLQPIVYGWQPFQVQCWGKIWEGTFLPITLPSAIKWHGGGSPWDVGDSTIVAANDSQAYSVSYEVECVPNAVVTLPLLPLLAQVYGREPSDVPASAAVRMLRALERQFGLVIRDLNTLGDQPTLTVDGPRDLEAMLKDFSPATRKEAAKQ